MVGYDEENYLATALHSSIECVAMTRSRNFDGAVPGEGGVVR